MERTALKTRSVSEIRMNGELLTSWCQFGWGAFGGAMVVLFAAVDYAASLHSNAPWPNPRHFKAFLILIVWLAFPVVSGFASELAEPHSRLLAAFEGACLPSLFYIIAKHTPFLKPQPAVIYVYSMNSRNN